MISKLSNDEIDTFLPSMQTDACHWSVRDGKLCSSLTFQTFKEAFAFMTSVALHAESCDHHPEWCNVYNHIEIALTTHAAGGITQKDIELATYITRIYPRFASMIVDSNRKAPDA